MSKKSKEQVKKKKTSSKKVTPSRKNIKPRKVKKADTKESKLTKELNSIAQLLSGEMALREKEEMLEEAKKKAKNKRRAALIKHIEKGDVAVEKDEVQSKEVVQNIKLFTWKAPIRTKFAFDMKAFLGIAAAALVFVVFLAILSKYLLMLAIMSLLFLIYVAGTTDPIDVEHTITARGIDTMDKLYEWFMLDDFMFTIKNGQHILVVETRLYYPSRLILLLDEKDRAALFMLLKDQLLYRDVRKQSWTEKATFGEYVSLEDI